MAPLKLIQILLSLTILRMLNVQSLKRPAVLHSSWLHQTRHPSTNGKTKIDVAGAQGVAFGWDPFSKINGPPMETPSPKKASSGSPFGNNRHLVIDAYMVPFGSSALNVTTIEQINQIPLNDQKLKSDKDKIKTAEIPSKFAWNPFPNTNKQMEKLPPGWNPWPSKSRGRQKSSSSSGTASLPKVAMNSTLSHKKDSKSEVGQTPNPKKKKKILNFGFKILKTQVHPLLKKPSVRAQWIHVLIGSAVGSFQFLPAVLSPNIDAQAVGVNILPEIGRLLIAPQVLSPRLRHQLVGVRLEPRLLSLKMLPQVLSPEINTQLVLADLRLPRGFELLLVPRVLSPELELQLVRTRPDARAWSVLYNPGVLSPIIRLALFRRSPVANFKNSKLFIGGVLSPFIVGSLGEGKVITLFEDGMGELFEAFFGPA